MASIAVMLATGAADATRAGASPPAGMKSMPEPLRPAEPLLPTPDVRLLVSMRNRGLKSV
jgi:hypothetical protein